MFKNCQSCLYVAYSFGAIELAVGISHFFLHPFESDDEDFEDDETYDNIENYQAVQAYYWKIRKSYE